MRTIIVIFTERKLSLNEVASYKRYKFLCNYDTVSLYDMVEDPRYTGKMMVVGFTCDTDRVQQGITLKDIYITKVNGQVINQPAGTDLAIIAKFFNGSWKKTTNNTGYFLGNFNGVGVYQHNTVQYAGVVYFRNQEDAIKAVKILGKRVKSLFD